MCGRFTPVSEGEMQRVAQRIQQDAEARQLQLPLAGISDARQLNMPPDLRDRSSQTDSESDVFPTDPAPVIAMGHTRMGIARLSWGFQEAWHDGPLFNARIEKAATDGSVWHDAFLHRRCIIVARAFFERSDRETAPSPKTGKPVKRLYRFETERDGAPTFLYIAGLYQQGRFTMLTCEPDTCVGQVHSRMPLLLDFGQCAPWLSGATPAPGGPTLASTAL